MNNETFMTLLVAGLQQQIDALRSAMDLATQALEILAREVDKIEGTDVSELLDREVGE